MKKNVYDATYFAVKGAITDYSKNLLKEKQATEQNLREVITPPSAAPLDYPTKAREFAYTGEQTVWKPQRKEQPGDSLQTESIRFGGFEIQPEQRHVSDGGAAGYGENLRAENHQDTELTLDDLKYLELDKLFGARNEASAPEQETSPTASEPEREKDTEPASAEAEPVSVRVCGELFKTYILAEVENQFLIVDKHAAHERILYEKLREAHADIEGQMLLTPMTLTFPREDYLALLSNGRSSPLGFDIDDLENALFRFAPSRYFWTRWMQHRCSMSWGAVCEKTSGISHRS